MNELTITTNKTDFKNPELTEATKKIIGFGANASAALMEIAKTLATVSANEVYKEDGFNSAQDYAMQTFGFKKAFAYDLVAVGTRQNSKFALEGYSVSQVKELLPCDPKDLEEAIENGDINPAMTTKELREASREMRENKRAGTKREPTYLLTEILSNTTDGATTEAELSKMQTAVLNVGGMFSSYTENGDKYVVTVLEDGVHLYNAVRKPTEKKTTKTAKLVK